MLSERNRNIIKDGKVGEAYNRLETLHYLSVKPIVEDFKEDLLLFRHLVANKAVGKVFVCNNYGLNLRVFYKELLDFEDCITLSEGIKKEINTIIADEVFSVIGD